MDTLAEQARKKRFFNRILIVSGLSALIYFAGYSFFTKRKDREIYLPNGFSGWVTIRYEKAGAPPLDVKNGHYIIHVNDSGIVETSTRLQTGWGRDDFYFESPLRAIPKSIDSAGAYFRYIHDPVEANIDYTGILLSLPDNIDTTLWEGSRIRKRGQQIDIKQGRKLLEHFFVSAKPELVYYYHDSLPPARKSW